MLSEANCLAGLLLTLAFEVAAAGSFVLAGVVMASTVEGEEGTAGIGLVCMGAGWGEEDWSGRETF